jgi:hypothetical protein
VCSRVIASYPCEAAPGSRWPAWDAACGEAGSADASRGGLPVHCHREPGALARSERLQDSSDTHELFVHQQAQLGIGGRVAAGRERLDQRG